MSDVDPIGIDLAYDGGALQLDATCDLGLVVSQLALKQRLLLGLLTPKGAIPYFPDDGAGAEDFEGGPGGNSTELARRARAQAGRDPDVLRVGEVTAREGADGTTVVNLRVATRRSPTVEELISLTVPR